MGEYLKESKEIDFSSPVVAEKIREIKSKSTDRINYAENAFNFVRDEISHSWDAQDVRVTSSASEVLREGVGICWAKSNLLAALMRGNGIPCGICYQSLPFSKSKTHNFVVHALNAVYLEEYDKWIRLDARGNKPGVNAEFSVGEEKLAFFVDEKVGAKDYKIVYPEPLVTLTEILRSAENMIELYLNGLPEFIS